jgi:DNA-binding transcriptional LysR family regulator
MLDLNNIVVFARVVESGSFTAAARMLGMPKTTVSRRIASLEREVGVRLVQRTTRNLNMTDAGRLYYEQSSQALRTIEDANLRLAEARVDRPARSAFRLLWALGPISCPAWRSIFLQLIGKPRLSCILPTKRSIQSGTGSTLLSVQGSFPNRH